MAIARQSLTVGADVTASSATTSVTVNSGSDLLLLVAIHVEVGGDSVSTVTWNGASLTELEKAFTLSWGQTQIWYLKNPTPATGNLVTTFTGSVNARQVAYVFTGVDQTTTFRTTQKTGTGANGASSTLTVPSVASSDYLVDALTVDATGHAIVAGANQTEEYDDPVFSACDTGGSTQSGANGGDMSWTWTTGTTFAHVATALIDANAPAPDPPVVETTAETAVSTAGTNHVINLPSGITAGDLLLLVLAKGSVAATVNAHADWTEILDENAATGFYIAYRIATGSEGATTTLVTSANTRSATIAYRISGADPATAPQVGTTATGSSTTPDPPSLTPSGGPKDFLWIAALSRGGEEADDDTWATTAPTGFTNLLQKACGTAGTNLAGIVATAQLQETAATKDPATFTIATGAWRAQTIAVHPAPSGSAHDEFPADSVTMSDAVIFSLEKGIADTVALADSLSRVMDVARTIPDTVAVSDSLSSAKTIPLAADDTVALSDNTDLAKGKTVEPADSVTMSDAQVYDRGVAAVDSVSIGDSLSSSKDIPLAPSDSVTMSDNAAVGKELLRDFADSISMSDLAESLIVKALSIDDTVSLSDSITLDRGIALADTVALTDQITFDRETRFDDAVALADALAVSFGLSVDDVVAISDLATPVREGSGTDHVLNPSDSVTVDDALSFIREVLHADSVSMSDFSFRAINGIVIEDGVVAVRGQGIIWIGRF